MSSLSSAPLVLENVTVTPNVFELKKCYQFCNLPSACTYSHRRIIFGDLAYLDLGSEDVVTHLHKFYQSSRDFSLGNYSISVVNFNRGVEPKPMIIFHHENVDPCLLATTLLDRKRMDKNEGSTVQKCGHLLWTMDQSSSWLISCSDKKARNNHPNANDYNSAQKSSLELVWKLDPGDIENTADRRMPNLDSLFYFLNYTAWFEHKKYCFWHRSLSDTGKVYISALTGGIYQLEAMNQTIGIAVNPMDVFGDAEVSSEVIPYSLHNCFAVVLHGFVGHGYREVANVDLPKESFLYENVYRSFCKFGEQIDNPYYGNNDDSEFARLPDTVFVNILLYLPWRQRIQCRRVNKRWRAVANSATAIDTKVIDLSNKQYKGMHVEHLNFLLPIVSNNLEKFIWSNSRMTGGIFNFEVIRQVQLFPKLRKIHINEQTPDFDGFFSMLSKCPNLKELSATIPRRPSSSSCTPGHYITVEKLCLINIAGLTGHWLNEVTDYFPMLTALCVYGYTLLSASCISAVAEKYGETLTRLEIVRSNNGWACSRSTATASMIGAVTGFGNCPYLEYLSLVGTEFISAPCMAAIGAGCAKLTTLDISGSRTVTNEGLVTLASLPNLKRLDLSDVGYAGDLSFGIAQLAKAGHLEQLLVMNARYPSTACLKTCVRYCRQLKLVDISGSRADHTIDDAAEIIQLYGTWSLNSRLMFRSDNMTWQERAVRMVQDEITATFNRRFVIVVPHYPFHSKWAPEDDADPGDYGIFYSESDYEDEDEDDA